MERWQENRSTSLQPAKVRGTQLVVCPWILKARLSQAPRSSTHPEERKMRACA
jgi:hypothetical protein